MTDVRLQRAIELVQTGKIKEGRELFEFILKTDLQNIPAWFGYIETWPTISQRIKVLEACLRFNPTNAQAKQALVDLIFHQESVRQHSESPAPKPESAIPEPASVQSISVPRNTFSYEQKTRVETGDAIKAPQPQPLPDYKPGLGRGSSWLLFGSITLLFAFLAVLGYMVYTSTPKDASQYRHDQPGEYYLYVPKNYSSDHDWPLFVGIHGSGGSGLDCWNWWQTYADREGFILLCPSIADAGGGWYQSDGETKTFNAINQVRANYRVMSREFIVGFSAGAQFVQGFSFKYPQYVSGVSILSAGNYYAPNFGSRGIPFLVVIGDQDDPVSVQGSAAFSAALSQGGFDIQYVTLPGVGHTITDKGRELTIALFRKTIGK